MDVLSAISVMLLASRGGDVACFVLVIGAALLAISCRRTDLRCSRCQEINRPQARFCAHCGQPLHPS